MPLFDFFRKRRPEPEQESVPTLPQLCYSIAYFILPNYAHQDLDRLREITSRNIARPFFYVMACQHHKIEPDLDIVQKFQWHSGTFSDGSTHLTLEYPTPPDVDLSDPSLVVLAPYFSSIIETKEGTVCYFILGQSPIGRITLRTVTPDGANANLGPGTVPILEEFLDRISLANGGTRQLEKQ